MYAVLIEIHRLLGEKKSIRALCQNVLKEVRLTRYLRRMHTIDDLVMFFLKELVRPLIDDVLLVFIFELMILRFLFFILQLKLRANN